MSYSAEALRNAIELHKKTVEKYKEAINSAQHEETRQALQKIIGENETQIESAQWIVMAEAGQLAPSESPQAAAPETGATKLAAGKCPFSGQFKEMGIDISNFDMSKFDMSKVDMSKLKDAFKA